MMHAPDLPRRDEPLWTADDVAAFLRISTSMVYKLARGRALPAVKVGTLLRFDPEAVRAFTRGRVVPLPRR